MLTRVFYIIWADLWKKFVVWVKCLVPEWGKCTWIIDCFMLYRNLCRKKKKREVQLLFWIKSCEMTR